MYSLQKLMSLLLVYLATAQEDNVFSVTEVIQSSTVQICSVCTCSEIKRSELDSEIVLNIQCSELDRTDKIPDLNRVEWPENPNQLKVAVSFEGLGRTTVERLPSNRMVETLSFSNNLIKTFWPGAFGDLPNLRKLSFAQNDLTEITQDLFTNLANLEDLDLSYNKLSEFNRLDFAELKNLKKLNLQSNSLKKVPLETLENNSKLEDLDLSKNAIFNLQFKNSESNILKTVKRLNLNGNQLPNILKEMLPENSLELLDLSNNVIANVEDSAFSQCTRLRELNLASNQIASTFTLPGTLLSITLDHNRLQEWPAFPSGITYVDLSYNELVGLYDQNYAEFDHLEILKVSGNQLTAFDLQTRLPQLFTLDISYNLLQQVPSNINSQMLPSLGELRLDGNPIRDIYFEEKISLRTLYLSDLGELTGLKENALSNVASRSEVDEGLGDCVHVYLTNCPALVEINEAAFNGTPVCMLDISYNNLSSLPRRLVEWAALKEGLNLQGNRWDCGCPMQWVLEELLPRIYNSHPQYLHELRCQTPRSLQGLRMVHWLNWGEKALCSDNYLRTGPNESYMLEPTDQPSLNILTGASSLSLTLGALIIVALLIAIALSVYLARSRNRSYRVRQAMLRKRQTMQDTKQQNGRNSDQFAALNRA